MFVFMSELSKMTFKSLLSFTKSKTLLLFYVITNPLKSPVFPKMFKIWIIVIRFNYVF